MLIPNVPQQSQSAGPRRWLILVLVRFAAHTELVDQKIETEEHGGLIRRRRLHLGQIRTFRVLGFAVYGSTLRVQRCWTTESIKWIFAKLCYPQDPWNFHTSKTLQVPTSPRNFLHPHRPMHPEPPPFFPRLCLSLWLAPGHALQAEVGVWELGSGLGGQNSEM